MIVRDGPRAIVAAAARCQYSISKLPRRVAGAQPHIRRRRLGRAHHHQGASVAVVAAVRAVDGHAVRSRRRDRDASCAGCKAARTRPRVRFAGAGGACDLGLQNSRQRVFAHYLVVHPDLHVTAVNHRHALGAGRRVAQILIDVHLESDLGHAGIHRKSDRMVVAGHVQAGHFVGRSEGAAGDLPLDRIDPDANALHVHAGRVARAASA